MSASVPPMLQGSSVGARGVQVLATWLSRVVAVGMAARAVLVCIVILHRLLVCIVLDAPVAGMALSCIQGCRLGSGAALARIVLAVSPMSRTCIIVLGKGRVGCGIVVILRVASCIVLFPLPMSSICLLVGVQSLVCSVVVLVCPV